MVTLNRRRELAILAKLRAEGIDINKTSISKIKKALSGTILPKPNIKLAIRLMKERRLKKTLK